MNEQIVRLMLLVYALLLSPAGVDAGDSFAWEPITAADWGVIEDTTKGIHNAVMLFEKVVADDRKLKNQRCYLTIYRRIKIFNAKGRKWGDIKVPYIYREQKVEKIRGRTILPDGQEFSLSKSQIFEKEIYKTKGVKIKQTSFSLPGISDGCIIEYVIKYRIPEPNGIWVNQKEIAMLRGEYRWLFYRRNIFQQNRNDPYTERYSSKSRLIPEDSEIERFRQIADQQTEPILIPKHIWLHNNARPITVELRPSSEDPREFFFAIGDVPAFVKEPYSLPEAALQEQLRCYYVAGNSSSFWEAMVQNVSETLDKYCRKNNRVRKIITSLGNLKTDSVKIQASYHWLQEKLKNISYLDSNRGFKENNTSDEALKRGYGTQADINYIFYSLLHEMNMDAKIAYAVDRNQDLLVPEAKYWQLHRSLVAVPTSQGGYRFYSPGDLLLPTTHVPWFNEGVKAFVVGDTNQQFFDIPFSNTTSNRTQRVVTLRLKEDLKLEGEMIEHHSGHSARNIRLRLTKTAEARWHEQLQSKLADILPDAKIDSISVKDVEEPGKTFRLKCKIQFANTKKRFGTRLFLQPFDFLGQTTNPFQADIRHYPIMFDYAYEIIETLNIEMSDNWKVEGLPEDTSFANKAGFIRVTFTTIGQRLSVQRMFRLNYAFWPASAYALVRKLCQTRQALNTLTVVLNYKYAQNPLDKSIIVFEDKSNK